MIGWCTLWKCAVACRFGELSQQPTWPQDMHSRRCTQRPPVLRQSSQPSPLAVTSRTWSRCVHTGIGNISVRRPRESRTIRGVTGPAVVLITTFLASAVEAIEMVTIVVGVGATRGRRSTIIGAVAGCAVLTVVVVVVGAALTAIPIGALRFIVGALLLVFGLQWFRKGVVRVAARGLAGIGEAESGEAERWRGRGIDWTAFVLAFKGVILEGL